MSRRRARQRQDGHWLARRGTVRVLWWGFVVVLALTVLAQLAVPVKAHFRLDDWYGFGAVFGFASCVVLILIAKLMGRVLQRPQAYYGEGDEDA